jgi:lysophospholipase L1-like esterase
MIVAIGDSITAGQGLHPASAWPYRIPGRTIYAAGVPGDTTRLGLERFPRDVQAHEPEAVIIQFGHNDANRWQTDRGLPRVSEAAFLANLVEMVARCRAFDAVPYLCTLTPTWRSEALTRDTFRYNDIVREVAFSRDVALIDVRAAFGNGEGALLDDGLHLSDAGQLLFAQTVDAALPVLV